MTRNFHKDIEIAANQFSKEKEYWRDKFSGDLVLSHFPYDFLQTVDDQITPGTVNFSVSGELYQRLISISGGSFPKLHLLLTASLVALLHKYTGHNDIVIATPIDRQETGDQFSNTVLALRNRFQDTASFKELTLQVRQTIVEAIENQNYPLQALVRQLNANRKTGDTPLFDVAIVLENIQDKDYLRHVNTGVTFLFNSAAASIHGQLEYDPRRYEKSTARRIARHFLQFIQVALFNADMQLDQVSLMTPEEEKQTIVDFNHTPCPFPEDKTIHRLFREQAGRTPRNVAVSEPGTSRRLTYAQLDSQSDQVARVLIDKGVTAQSIVGLIAGRSIETVAGILGILKAGGAFLPIDPNLPPDRIRFMLTDSQARFLVTTHPIPPEVPFSGETLNLDTLLNQSSPQSPPDTPPRDFSPGQPSHLAYIIYTSGTTGRPKGVMVEHRGLVNYISWAAETYLQGQQVTLPLYTSIAFDLTVTSVFVPLVTGGTIAVYSDVEEDFIIQKIIDDDSIRVVKTTPSHLKLIRDKKIPASHSHERCFIVGGEDLDTTLARDIYLNFHRNVRIFNEYGPTETVVGSMIHKYRFDRDTDHSVPIGMPIANTKIYLLDKSLNPVPTGIPGEIYIGGVGVARGYLNQPDLTSRKFPANPFIANQSMYKTGDLAVRLPDNLLRYAGRIDRQVKIRGFRIETGEIENQLLKHPAVSAAIVTPREDSGGNMYLCAYIVTPDHILTAQIREFAAQSLPGYMIPSFFVNIPRIPLTPNGKIDLEALPDPAQNLETNDPYAAPETHVERKLQEIWSDVLEVEKDKIGIDANFFELGGHSLNATTVISRIHKELNVKVPLKELFRALTIRNLARYIAGALEETHIPIQKAPEMEYYPLSSAQKRLFALQQLFRDSTAYNIPHVFQLAGKANKKKLTATFRKLIQRHENFRVSILLRDGEPVQKIHPRVDFQIEHYAIDAASPIEDIEETRRQVIHMMHKFVRPFDLSQPPFLRVGLITLKTIDAHISILMSDMHHIISDRVSQAIMIKDFLALQDGEKLPPLKLQYKDYAQWQNQMHQSPFLKAQETFWKDQFSRPVPFLQLPADFPRPAIQDFAGSLLHFELQGQEATQLKAVAMKEEVTMFMLLLAIYTVFLSRLSSGEDIVVGTPVAGRRHVDLENIIGMFLNTLALRNFPRRDITFTQFLREVKENTLQAFENQEYQFEELVELINIPRDLSRNPLFDVLLSVQELDDDYPEGTAPGREHDQLQFEENVAKFDLTLNALVGRNKLYFAFEYCTRLFKPQTIRRFVQYFKATAASVLRNPDIPISQIQLIAQQEKEQLLFTFNNTDAPYPAQKTLATLIRLQVEKTPDSPAIVCQNPGTRRRESLTYAQFHQKANKLAHHLKSKGFRPGSIAGLMVHRSIQMMVGLYAILKAGGAYLPIDPEHPVERIDYMLKDSAAPFVLTQPEFIHHPFPRHVQVLDLHAPESYSQNEDNPPEAGNPGNLAYVTYTSGSTGKPKGVMIENTSVVNFIEGVNAIIPFSSGDNILSLTTISFDIFGLETLGPLTKGMKVVIGNREEQVNLARIAAVIKDEKINIFQVTPSRLQLILSNKTAAASLQALKYLLVGGELFPDTLLQEVTKVTPCRIFNMYGPTETTIWSTVKEVTNLSSVHIGKPIANTRVYILDRNHTLQPVGSSGELCISGDGLARGYINNPQLTHEQFIPNPYSYPGGERLYKTGDLAHWQPDGNLQVLGRLDHQLKIRGFRIEPGEIENCLLTYEGVREAVVIHKKDKKDGVAYLCAYIAADEEIDISRLNRCLSQKLPEYMVPSYIIPLREIPLTPNGKADRKKLPEPQVETAPYEAPQNEIEEKLAAMWCDVLDLDRVGVNDSFFDLGGNSFKLIKVISSIYEEFQVELSITQVYKDPRIKSMAASIFTNRHAEELVVLLNQEKHRKIFCFPPLVGYGLVYKDLAQLLEDYALYGFVFIEEEDRTSRYIHIIKEHQPRGPYRLLAWSGGGKLTFEVARGLEEQGDQVSRIILVDSHLTDQQVPGDKIEEEISVELQRMEQNLINLGLQFLKETVKRKMINLVKFNNNVLTPPHINAHVHLITSEGARELRLKSDWGRYTRKSYSLHDGVGPHDKMLTPPYVEENAAIIRRILNQSHQ